MDAPLDTSSVHRALATTRSVRRRIDFDRPLPPEVIERCVAVAIQAPTGLSAQSWRFVVVTQPSLKQAIAEQYREAFDELSEERLAELRENATQTVLLPAGYMDRAVLRPAERKGPAEVTYWNAWGRGRG